MKHDVTDKIRQIVLVHPLGAGILVVDLVVAMLMYGNWAFTLPCLVLFTLCATVTIPLSHSITITTRTMLGLCCPGITPTNDCWDCAALELPPQMTTNGREGHQFVNPGCDLWFSKQRLLMTHDIISVI